MGFERRLALLSTLALVVLAESCRSPPEFCHDCATGGASDVSQQGGTTSAPTGGAPPKSGQGGSPDMSPQGGVPAAPMGGAPAESGQSGQSAQSGQGGESHAAGAAGAAGSDGTAGEPPVAPPECANDGDCADAKACNGAEHCNDGRCESGAAVTCPSISECFEAKAGAECRYSPGERFVVYTGDEFGDSWDNAIAVPIARLAQPVRLNFSAGAMDEEFGWISTYSWSPNGRRLIFAAQTTDFINDVWDQKFFWFDVTESLPGQPRRVPNVRIDDNGTFRVLDWSPTSNAVVIGRDGEKYVVRFTASGAETALVPTAGRILPCGDDATVAYGTEEETRLANVWDVQRSETLLPAKLLSVSPDGGWLLLSDDHHAYLARCSLDTQLEMLGGPARVTSSWSPNSKYVVYSDNEVVPLEDATPKALSAFRVESSEKHESLFEGVSADPEVRFEPESTRFLFVERTPKDERVYRLVDLQMPSSSVVLPLPAEIGSTQYIVAYMGWLGTTGRLSYSKNQGEAAGTYVIEARSTAEPRLVRANVYDVRFSEDGTRAVWVESISDGPGARSQTYTLDLTRSDSQPHALFAEPLTGMLRMEGARIITRFVIDPAIRFDLFAVPPNFEGEPVQINAGKVKAGPLLQPRP